MASKIKIKRSSVAGKIPTTADIDVGELAINIKDQKLYSSNGSAVFQIAATASGGVSITTATVKNLTQNDTVVTNVSSYANSVVDNSLLQQRATWSALTSTNTAIRALVSDRLQVANAAALYTTKASPTTSGVLAHTGRATISTNLTVSGNTSIVGLKANNSLGTAGQVLKTNGTSVYWDAAATGGGGSATITVTKTTIKDLTSSDQVVTNLTATGVSSVTVVNNSILNSKASWTELLATNTAIRSLISDKLQVANAAAIYQTKAVERAALANTNSYIATKAPLASPTFTGTVSGAAATFSGLLTASGRATVGTNLTVSGNTTIGAAGKVANATGWFGVAGRATVSTNLFVGANTITMGNFGVGTSSPGFPFQIRTNPSTAAGIIAQINPTTSTNASQLNFNNGGSGSVYVGRASSTGTGPGNATISAYDTFFWNSGTQNIVFGTGDTIRATIDTSGNLLVGTTTSPTTSGIALGSGLAVTFSYSGYSSFRNNMYLGSLYWNNGSDRLTLDASGNLTAAGNVTAYSDENLKENVFTIENALALIEQMRGVRYNRIDTGKAGVGVIAQEVQKVVPEVVHEGEHLSVAYGNLVGVLIEAVKELSARVKELESK